VVVLHGRKIGSMVKRDAPGYSLWGVFKHGVIAISVENDVIYFTGINVHGPYNLWIPGFSEQVQNLKNGQKVLFETDEFIFPEANLRVNTKTASPWPAYKASQPGNPIEIRSAVQAIIHTTIESKMTSSEPFMSLAGHWGYQISESIPSSTNGKLGKRVRELNDTLLTGDIINAQKAGFDCLGLGGGLTPAGDDFLAGILTMFFILRNQRDARAESLESFGNRIVSEASGRTNVISNAFIKAAQFGEVNDPLRPILDLLLGGKETPLDLLQRLANTGHTSGFDGLAGGLLALNLWTECRNNQAV
jgi:hypothetical protein